MTVTVKEEGEAYLLLVRDNGPGIRGEDMETIFFDGYSTKFDARTGNVQRGVGLTVVKDYVENYFHGSIRVESEVGRFTQFTPVSYTHLPESNPGPNDTGYLFDKFIDLMKGGRL